MSVAVAVRGEALWLSLPTDTRPVSTNIPKDQATDAQELILPAYQITNMFLSNQGPISALPLAIS